MADGLAERGGAPLIQTGGPMGESLWDEREQKILEAVAEAERDPGPPHVDHLTQVTGLHG